jgi:hypothetical protein
MPWTSHESQTAFETSDDLSQLRAAEERIRELEAKVRLLEDKADRAERWVYIIWVEIEQKFFGGERFVSRNVNKARDSNLIGTLPFHATGLGILVSHLPLSVLAAGSSVPSNSSTAPV